MSTEAINLNAVCPIDNELFEKKPKHKKFCSQACKRKADTAAIQNKRNAIRDAARKAEAEKLAKIEERKAIKLAVRNSNVQFIPPKDDVVLEGASMKTVVIFWAILVAIVITVLIVIR